MFRNIKYCYLLTLFTCVKLVAYCECSDLHNSAVKSASRKLNDADIVDDVESSSLHSDNLINQPNSFILNEPLNNEDYQYYNPMPPQPPQLDTAIQSPYEPNYIDAPIQQNHSYYTQLSPLYKSNSISNSNHNHNNAVITNDKPTILRITTTKPAMADLISWPPFLENYYVESFRSIKSSVMHFVYKLQDFIGYLAHFFDTGESLQFSLDFNE